MQKVGGTKAYSWRVDSEIIPPAKEGESEKYRFDDMVTELAYRIFADLEFHGAVPWKALSAFSAGLQVYRDCLRIPKDRKLNLKKAQRKFIEALAEDTNFDLAYYNLGVVYTELGQKQAAEVTFLEAIDRNPRVWRAYYALMVNSFQSGRDTPDIPLCERVIGLKPAGMDLAKAYHSMGLARRHLNDLNGAIKNHKKAVFHAWKALCKFERSRQRTAETATSMLPQLETIASVCLADLAVAYSYRARTWNEKANNVSVGLTREIAIFRCWHAFRRAKVLFRQALFLNRSNANFYFELGKLCDEWEKYNQAIWAYQHAIQIYPERIEYWAYLALAYARLKQRNEAAALSACNKVLDYASYASETALDALERTKEAYNWLAKDEQGQHVAEIHKQGQRVAEIHTFLQELEEDIQLERGLYEEAISCFRISRSLGYTPQKSTFYLAYAYLKNKEYDASTELFKSLCAELEGAKKNGKLNNTPDGNTSEDQWTPDKMLVMAYCGLAFSYAERDIRLEEGINLIKMAQEHMDTLNQDKQQKFSYPSSFLDCKGWLLTKQGETDEAIKSLEQALALDTGAETYWHLAMAYARKLQNTSKGDPKLQFLITQVKVYCQHVQELDLNGEFEQRRQDLLRYLEGRDQREQQENAQEQKQATSLANEDASTKAIVLSQQYGKVIRRAL